MFDKIRRRLTKKRETKEREYDKKLKADATRATEDLEKMKERERLLNIIKESEEYKTKTARPTMMTKLKEALENVQDNVTKLSKQLPDNNQAKNNSKGRERKSREVKMPEFKMPNFDFRF